HWRLAIAGAGFAGTGVLGGFFGRRLASDNRKCCSWIHFCGSAVCWGCRFRCQRNCGGLFSRSSCCRGSCKSSEMIPWNTFPALVNA
ncbi:hypothetical protein Avbf_15182, partial [Armadillidium vulgare]